MKSKLSSTILIFCLLFSVSSFAQVRKNEKVSAKRGKADVTRQILTTQVMKMTPASSRKMMPYRNDKIWLLGTNTIKGHWSKPLPNEITTFYKNKQFFPYSNMSYGFRAYSFNQAMSKSVSISIDGLKPKKKTVYKIPKKTFNINTIKSDWDWIHKKKIRAKNLVGSAGKTNVYFFKKINKNFPISFTSSNDHIIVTDTLYAPIPIISAEREKRNYIKIIANCIVYESPIKAASLSRSNTDLVFSAKKIIFKSRYENLQKTELTPAPPFVFSDASIKIHVDPFSENERKLVNRLFIGIMGQIITDLNSDIDDWEKDKLLSEFQNYRKHKVNSAILYKDPEWRSDFNKYCGQIDNKKINKSRRIDDLDIIVEADLDKVHQTPFKYYALPSKATVLPVKNEETGISDALGSIFYQATGDSKLIVTTEVELGYDSEMFDKASQELNLKGLVLNKSTPKELLKIEEQPLRIRGKTIGKTVPISNELLRLEIQAPDNTVFLNELFPLDNSTTFDIIYKANNGQNEFTQKMVLNVPKDILSRLNQANIIDEFNVIESNTITDDIQITSQLSPNFNDDSGPLDYIEISLEFQFENQKVVHRGPFRMSSFSVLASVKDISFIKHSENFKVKVTGTAYYEFAQKDLKDDTLFDSKFIVIEESLFKDN